MIIGRTVFLGVPFTCIGRLFALCEMLAEGDNEGDR